MPGDIRSGSAKTTSKPMPARASLGQTRDEIGDERARPRPLPELLQALFVDIDDDDRPLRCIARMQHLKEIENADAKLFDRTRDRPSRSASKRDQQQKRSARAKPNRRAKRAEPLHSKIACNRAKRCRGHFSRNARMN